MILPKLVVVCMILLSLEVLSNIFLHMYPSKTANYLEVSMQADEHLINLLGKH